MTWFERTFPCHVEAAEAHSEDTQAKELARSLSGGQIAVVEARQGMLDGTHAIQERLPELPQLLCTHASDPGTPARWRTPLA